MPEGRCYKKVFWEEISSEIALINPKLHELIEPLSPGKDYPIYIFNYMYGDLIGDDKGVFFPQNGKLLTLGEPDTPPELISQLGYGIKTSPLGMILKKSFEWYISDRENNSSYPIHIDKPGDFFNTPHVTGITPQRRYLPNGILSVRSGINSTFILSKIGCKKQHKALRPFSVSSPAPKDYHDHSAIFREIARSRSFYNWQSSIAYFSQSWIQSIKNDPAWSKVKDFFFTLESSRKEYSSYTSYYNHIFRAAFDNTNSKASLFVQDTARYCYEILLGEKFGLAPATNEQGIPIDLIREVYRDYYKLDSAVIIMAPAKVNNTSRIPVYLSLQHPPFYVYEKNSRGKITRMKEIEQLHKCLYSYQKQFSSPMKECAGTYLEEVSKLSKFNFYHNQESNHAWMAHPEKILTADPRFSSSSDHAPFPSEAPLFTGCIAVSLNNPAAP